jgi:hypothetical protein
MQIFQVMSDDRVLVTDPSQLPSSCAHAKGLDLAARSIFVQACAEGGGVACRFHCVECPGRWGGWGRGMAWGRGQVGLALN